MKIISMTEFVLSLNSTTNTSDEYAVNAFLKSVRYAQFLSQPLTLGMFLPCDLDGNVIEKPFSSDFDHYDHQYNENVMDAEGFELYSKAMTKWDKAKERVLFQGFEYSNGFAHTSDFEGV